jgi:hypothetical protein
MEFMEQNGNTLNFTAREVQLGNGSVPKIADIVDLPELHTQVVNEMARREAQALQWSQSPFHIDKGHAQTLMAEVAELGVTKSQMDAILHPNEVDAAIKRLTSN